MSRRASDWSFCFEAIGPLASDTAGLTYTRHFVEGLDERARQRMELLLSAPVPAELDLRGIRVRVLPAFTGRGAGKAVAAQLMVPFAGRRHGTTVLFCSGTIAPALAGVAGGPRVVVNVQNADTLEDAITIVGPGRQAYRRHAVPAGLRRADHVITVSEVMRAALVERFDLDPERVTVVPLAAETERFRPARPGEDRAEQTGIVTPYVLFVSVLWPYKNAARLIEAFGRVVAERGLPHRLVVAGKDGGDLERCREVARAARVEDRVDFLGHVVDPRLAALYRHADAFVYPSLLESFGLPVLEAMASGAPVVASNRWAIPEVCGGAARIADPENGELEDALGEVLASPAEQAGLRARGLARAAEFSWDRVRNETLAVIERVARGSGGLF